MKVAIIGTQGVPATYGGFESLVENLLGDNCPRDIEYTVFCSGKDIASRQSAYKGASLKYVPLHANGFQSIIYDVVSMCRSVSGYDCLLILGVSGCLFLPFLRLMTKSRILVNIDGLEYRRSKWGKAAKWLLKNSEAFAVRYAHKVIADNKGIQDYVAETYNKKAELVEYGGDHVKRELKDEFVDAQLDRFGLKRGGYAVTVCRIEPENNCDIILEALSKTSMPLIFIGNWNHSQMSRDLRNRYSSFENLHLVDSIYDLDVLCALRSNAAVYLHGHSAGGTNPSLVEAMFFGIPIIAFDVVYNRETTGNRAYYFKTSDDILSLLSKNDLNGAEMSRIAETRFRWSHVAKQYCNLFK